MDYKNYADNYKDCVWVDFKLLESFMKDTLMAYKVPEKDADIITDVLIESDKRGIDSHGIGRLKPIYLDRIDKGILTPTTKIDTIKETETTAVYDANNGMGHVVSKYAMQIAIDKAKKYGMGMTVVRNSTHYGIAGYYTSMASENNMIGISGTNARPSIAPTWGVENMLGTNPMTFGIPTDEAFDFSLDCATSTAQRGKIEVYGRSGKELPEGWVIGEEGETRTDTLQILKDLSTGKAALTPLGGVGEDRSGYKGYGYATVVEILSAALQNGDYLKELNDTDDNGKSKASRLGHFFIAINIENFIDPKIFRMIAGNIVRGLRDSKKAPGAYKIYTAGEKEYIAREYRLKNGCPVPEVLQKQMTELRDRLSLNYKFAWDK